MHEVKYSKKARKELRSIDFRIVQRIIGKVFEYSKRKNPLKFATRVKDKRFGEYKFRVGDYRVIFDVDSKDKIRILVILKIGHRKEIYKR